MSEHNNCKAHQGDSPWCLWCEITAVRSDRNTLREQHAKQRKEWGRERSRFRQEIATMQQQLAAARLELEGRALARIHAVSDVKERAAGAGR